MTVMMIGTMIGIWMYLTGIFSVQIIMKTGVTQTTLIMNMTAVNIWGDIDVSCMEILLEKYVSQHNDRIH